MSVDVPNVSVKVDSAANTGERRQSNAEYVKNIRKKRLEREVFADVSRAKELVKTQASPVYNASGELIASVSGTGK